MKELYILLGTFLFLTLGMHHQEWFSYPLEHIKNLPTAGAYGLGSLHPIIFTVLAYIIILIPRLFIKLIRRKK